MKARHSGKSQEELYQLREDLDTVLVVEDDYDLAVIFSRAISRLNLEARTIRSGDTAMTYLYAVVPRAMILDLNLPRVSGEQILRFVRGAEDERLRHLPIILATAFGKEARKRGVDKLADIVLEKPVSLDMLEVSLRRLLQQDAEQTPAEDLTRR